MNLPAVALPKLFLRVEACRFFACPQRLCALKGVLVFLLQKYLLLDSTRQLLTFFCNPQISAGNIKVICQEAGEDWGEYAQESRFGICIQA